MTLCANNGRQSQVASLPWQIGLESIFPAYIGVSLFAVKTKGLWSQYNTVHCIELYTILWVCHKMCACLCCGLHSLSFSSLLSHLIFFCIQVCPCIWWYEISWRTGSQLQFCFPIWVYSLSSTCRNKEMTLSTICRTQITLTTPGQFQSDCVIQTRALCYMHIAYANVNFVQFVCKVIHVHLYR